MFRELPHVALGHAQHLRHLGEGGARLKGGEAAHDRAAFIPMPGEDELHHVILAVVREINVDVREFVQRHALRVEESFEVEVESNRAHARNAQAVANHRIGGAAARDPFDALRAACLQNLPRHEEVGFVADGGDDVQLLLDLGRELRSALAVAMMKSLHHQPAQIRVSRGTIRRMEVRELRLAERKLELTPLRDFERVLQPFGMFLAGRIHPGGRAKVKSSLAALLRVRLTQQGQRADALHDVEFLPVLGRGVVNGGTRHTGEVRRNIARRHETVEGSRETFCEAGVIADGDQSRRQPVEFLATKWASLLIDHRGFVTVCCRSPGMVGEQAAELVIALSRFDIEQQWMSFDLQFHPQDRLHIRVPRRLHELHRTMQVAHIRERDRGHSVLLRQPDNGARRQRGIEERVMTVRPQRHVVATKKFRLPQIRNGTDWPWR